MENILIWGTGKYAEKFTQTALNVKEINILGFIDNDSQKQGLNFFGKQVFAPHCIGVLKFDKIVICTIYFNDIREQIIRDYPFATNYIRNYKYFLHQMEIIARYKDNPEPEIQQIVNFIGNRDLQVFNYDFSDKYVEMKVVPIFDEINEMFYLNIDNRKMYFASYLDTPEKVKQYYQSICIEQDENSPHRYLDEEFKINDYDVVVDVGVAEGNFTLSVIDKVKKVYLIETDERWIKALKCTFQNYKDKIVFINKFITSYTYDNKEILDNVIKEPVNFIKMDIEGSECDALDGIERVVEMSPELKIAACAYHNDYDEEIIKKKLDELGFKCSTTKGYMWSPYKKIITTKLCKGLVRGVKI